MHLCSTCCLLWDKEIAVASLVLRSMPEPVNSGTDCPEHEVHKKEGNQHFAAGDYVKAVAAYNKAIKSDPDNGVLYSNRAAAFIHLGKEIKAIKDAEQAIALKPDWAKGYFRKGSALAALRKWDEASEVLSKALELEPKSKEISTLLRDVNRKRAAEQGERKKEENKKSGLRLVAGGDSKESEKETTSVAFQPIGFSESIIEQFVKDSLTNVITQFSQQGEVKSIVYMQPSRQGEALQMIGIEAGFDSPQANSQCCDFLRTFAADNKALALLIIAEKRNVAFPQVWRDKSSTQWQWKESEHGIFMQLDALSIGAVDYKAERKVWFIPTGTAKGKPREPVELDIDLFAIMPPLLRTA
mmetsp:Transcript_48971/g.153806  ORF Transcript_48971/g.153806 Transcript_48971/m.153806 type:complete len:356 (-) Transcript_48971:37-1104(-)